MLLQLKRFNLMFFFLNSLVFLWLFDSLFFILISSSVSLRVSVLSWGFAEAFASPAPAAEASAGAAEGGAAATSTPAANAGTGG